jgi:RND superfamily putative drug exporter
MRLPDRLTSRRGAWVSLGIVLIAFVALFGLFSRVDAPSGTETAPSDSESSRVSALLDEFPDADEQSVIVVASRTDAGDLTASDLDALDDLAPAIGEHTGLDASAPSISEDGEAAVIVAPITVGEDNAETAEIVKDLRSALPSIDGLTLLVTGGPAFGADITSSFDG